MFRKKTIPTTHPAGLTPLLVVSLLLHSGVGAAAGTAPPAQYTIEQPSQTVAESLQSIAHETGTSVLFDATAVRGRVAHPVSGHLSAFEAITAALQGTGLVAEQMADGAVVVRPAAASAGAPVLRASGVPATGPSAEAAPGVPGVPAISDAGVPGATPGGVNGAALAGGQALDDASVVRVEITGTRLKRVEVDGPTPVNVYTAKDIEQSGQPNLERFLSSLNEVSASAGEGAMGSTLGQGTVQLRGLPLGSTLVLVNGRRIEAVGSSSGNFFNLNLIPMAAIERVEIVPVGSSAVYGGDALAGVVNVVLKKSIDGVSVSANLGSGRGFGDRGLSLATGGHGVDGSYLLMGSYSRTTPLSMAERGFFRDVDYRRFGGTDARMRYCTPGTVSSVSGANLPGLDSSFAAIPQLAGGQTPRLSDFESTAGTANLCSLYANGNGFPLVYGEDTLSLHATGEHRMVGSWYAFGEFTFARDRTEARDIGHALADTTVPASNPFNPFGEDVSVTTVLGPESGLAGFARQTRFTRALAGVRGELAGDWEAELTVSTIRDNGGSQTFSADVDATALGAALAATSPATALNPFTTGRSAGDDVLRGIWSDSDRTSRGRKDEVSALVRGSVLRLPAGPVEAVAGVESARDRYDVSILDEQFESHAIRRNSAAYGEIRAPLLKADAAVGAWSLAALTLAARRDRYSDFGSANTYQAGLELRPLRGLLIRASSATSFKPPTLLQTHVGDETDYPAALFGLVDPARGGEPITSGTVTSTANNKLTPEHGRANSLGAVWEPEGSLGTRLSATYWQVHVNGLIGLLSPQTALDNEALFPGFVTRGPSDGGQPGPVTNVLYSFTNFGSVNAAGTDMEAAYAWRGILGRWTATAGATRTNDYQVVVAPGAPKEDRLGRRFSDYWAPRWKSRAAIDLDAGMWSLGLTGRYLGQYKDADGSERRLGAYWMEDLAGSLDLKKCLPNLVAAVKAASLSLSVANLANRQPQFVGTFPFYDVTQADWRGRYVSTKVSIDW
jgi:iron complex outermembrane receptor protein